VTLALLGLAPPTPGRAHGLAASPIYIGQIVSLTGIYASFPDGPGRYQQATAKLAVRQINTQGGINGRPLELVLVDDHSTNTGAIAAFQRLTRARTITAIIVPSFSTEIQALTPYIKRAGIPVMIGGQAPILTHEGDPWVFRTRPNQIVEAKVLTTFAVTTLHLTRIAIIHTNDVAGANGKALLLGDLKALGVTPVTDQSFPNHAADLTAQVLAIKKSGATGLISNVIWIEDYLLLAREMHQIGVHLTWLGNPVMSVPPTRQQGGALFYGTYAGTDYVPGQSPEAAAFDKALEAAFHLPGVIGAAYIYDALNILAMVARKAGTDPRAIRSGILAVRGYRGVEGTYNFDRNGDGLRQYTIVQNVQGRLRVIKVLTF
jgi:branched-chain amino acid transport system substrate-binding protein